MLCYALYNELLYNNYEDLREVINKSCKRR
jgi:hypothetical protein